MTRPMPNILVLKLGALGDFVHAFHAFAAIRRHHPGDRVTLLTTAPFAGLAEASPWFDAVAVDERAPWLNLAALRRSLRPIRGADFVYDLQTSSRSNRYHWLAGRPAWSGIAAGCSHPHANKQRDFMHTVERQREQLQHAGLTVSPPPERAWLAALGGQHGVQAPYALLMPGGAGLGSVKRWPAARYAAVAAHLAGQGITPVIIGGAAERGLADAILSIAPAALDLTTRTTIPDIAALAQGAALTVGNDTGPVHLAASMGAPTIQLFSNAGVPAQAAARGPAGEWATVLKRDSLDDLPVSAVLDALRPLTAPPPSPAAGTSSPRSAG